MLRLGFIAVLLLSLGALALPAQAQSQSIWQRPTSSRDTDEERNPDWDKYAFELPVLGEPGSLSFEELVTDGQATVLFFWLADCPLCHLQMPYVEQFKQLADENGLPVRVVGINVDQRESDAEDYVAEKQPTFEMLFDGNARRTADPYDVDDLGCPLVYVFNSDGEYVESISGFKSNLSKVVLKLLDLEIPEK